MVAQKDWQPPFGLRFELFPKGTISQENEILFYGKKSDGAFGTGLSITFLPNSLKLRAQSLTEDNKFVILCIFWNKISDV